jgi:hypothetical protein
MAIVPLLLITWYVLLLPPVDLCFVSPHTPCCSYCFVLLFLLYGYHALLYDLLFGHETEALLFFSIK